MSWSWRRSTSIGPIRFNFSQAGVGVSVGVRGARISAGPRGTYVHIGAGGFRYTKRLDAPSGRPRTAASQPDPSPRPLPTAGRRVEEIDPAQMLESSADALLDEIRKQDATPSLVVISVFAGMAGLSMFALAVQAEGPLFVQWGSVALGIVALALLPWTAWWDRRSRNVHIHYEFDPSGDKVKNRIEHLLTAFQRAHAVWSVHTEHVHGDWKRNAGAGTSVGRRRIQLGWGPPAIIKTNARIGFLAVDGRRIYFLPDRLLIFGQGVVRAISYLDLYVDAGRVPFIEDGGVPADARVLGTTWRFVNKDGSPDRRFANNSQLPIVLYGTLALSSPSGLRLSLQTSSEPLAAQAHDLLQSIQSEIQNLQSRAGHSALSTVLPSFDDDPPPLLKPTMGLVRLVVKTLSFRWISEPPEWGVPIAWGLVFSLPMVGLVVRLAGAAGLPADLFLGAMLLVGGCGGLALVGAHLRSRHARREEKAAGRRARFHSRLMSELKTRPAARIDFSDLVEREDLSRAEADQVADEVFRRRADRVVEDGVVTQAERAKLELLAKVLEIDSDRAARILEEAKSDRHSVPTGEVLGTG